jgi:hypothetical protein
MSRSFAEFRKLVLQSHLGHVLLAISWCFILFVLVRPSINQPQFVDCVPSKDEVYWVTEVNHAYSIWTVLIEIAHFPSVLLTKVVTLCFQKFLSLSCWQTAKMELTVFFLFSSVQWLLVGYAIESFGKWMKSKKNDRRIQQALGADSPVSSLYS